MALVSDIKLRLETEPPPLSGGKDGKGSKAQKLKAGDNKDNKKRSGCCG
jgi:hypothetical protein